MANILWFLKESFSFLTGLLDNSIINFIYETLCQCVIDLVEAAQ